ncbi:MAG TPA: 1-deoxy-D-xylulose-5-phosphate reductoisomerase [Firmicutes bacterium]|nr:1-deoxy-D-xylulose-5-phosphate reductoisomerase [Candidatus Fermentithermobacillaceae bacterium]
MTSLSVLGSTGSIGLQTLNVVKNDPRLKVVALAAGSRWEEVLAQAKEFSAAVIALEDPEAARAAEREKTALGLDDLIVLSGPEGIARCAELDEAAVVVHAVPGFAGIIPLMRALESGKRVAFAGKEALVSAGELIEPYLRKNPGQLVPVDSEHSALFQCLLGEDPESVVELVLTASGGALRDYSAEQLRNVTPKEVLEHPTWKMGKKVTVDSATLVNKSLEVMEAHYLFGVPYEKLKVVVHRQSIVHSMVTFVDGSTKAQASVPDMSLAISYGITFPERHPGVVPSLSPYYGTLTFEEPDTDRFPGVLLGHRAGEMGGTAPCALSYADEILVKEFLNGRIGFLDITRTLFRFLDAYRPRPVDGLDVLKREALRAEEKIRELLL